MAYKPSQVIQGQIHPCGMVIVLFNPYLGVYGDSLFPKGISPKVNVLARLKIELANYDIIVQYIKKLKKTCSKRSTLIDSPTSCLK